MVFFSLPVILLITVSVATVVIISNKLDNKPSGPSGTSLPSGPSGPSGPSLPSRPLESLVINQRSVGKYNYTIIWDNSSSSEDIILKGLKDHILKPFDVLTTTRNTDDIYTDLMNQIPYNKSGVQLNVIEDIYDKAQLMNGCIIFIRSFDGTEKADIRASIKVHKLDDLKKFRTDLQDYIDEVEQEIGPLTKKILLMIDSLKNVKSTQSFSPGKYTYTIIWDNNSKEDIYINGLIQNKLNNEKIITTTRTVDDIYSDLITQGITTVPYPINDKYYDDNLTSKYLVPEQLYDKSLLQDGCVLAITWKENFFSSDKVLPKEDIQKMIDEMTDFVKDNTFQKMLNQLKSLKTILEGILGSNGISFFGKKTSNNNVLIVVLVLLLLVFYFYKKKKGNLFGKKGNLFGKNGNLFGKRRR